MELNKLVHQPTRLQIFAHLYANGETSFTDLTAELDVTEGNLASHIERMEEADCVAVDKQFVDRKPQTTYRLTDHGRDLFEEHIETLETLLDDLEAESTDADGDADSDSASAIDPELFAQSDSRRDSGPGTDPSPGA